MIALVGPANATEYALPLPTPELQEALDSLIDAGRLPELVDPHSLIASIAGDWPTPPATPWPDARLGSIYWPIVGLAHYAYACLLVDEYTLGQLRSQMTSAVSNTITVKLRDGTNTRTVAMKFLASRPLVRNGSGALTTTDNGTTPVDAWVVLLVDDRYRLVHAAVTSLTTTAWSDIFGAASITITDSVDADYLTPGTRWSTARVAGRSLAWLMDVAALHVGSRIVTVPGSAPALQRPTSTHATTLANAHDTASFCGGGAVEDADVTPGLPQYARVVFGAYTETTPVNVDVSIQADFDWGTDAYMTHWADAPASTSSGNRSALAAQWEADWELWQYDQYDTTYAGFSSAPASGFCWAVEWYHDGSQAYTKYVRAPHWYGYLLAPTNGAVSTAFSGASVYNSADISLTDGLLTSITFNSEDYDTDSYHSTSSATQNFTIPTTGYYHFGAFVAIDANAAGQRYIQVLINGAEYVGQSNGPVGAGGTSTFLSHLNVACDMYLTAGDTVSVQVAQTSGGTLAVQNDANHKPRMWIHRLGTP